MKKIGALWTGKTKDKDTYLHGEIEVVAGLPPVKIVVFKNKPREGGKPLHKNAPQYQIFVSRPESEIRPSEEDSRDVLEEDLG